MELAIRYSMAATTYYVPSQLRPETTHYPCYAPTELLENPWQTAPQTTTFKPDTKLRATPRVLRINVPRDPPVEEAPLLETEIEKLCTATLVIDHAFYNIGRRLSEVSEEQNKCVDLYNTCHALETRWDSHYQTYKDLIWRSREFAGEAQVAVDDFRQHVFPSLKDQCRTHSEKQETIQAQIRVLQTKSQLSQKLCQDFLDFGRALGAYITDFSRDVAGLGTGESNMKIDKLKDKLRSARGDMEAVNKEVKEVGWKLAADVTIAGTAVLLAFVAPTFWAKVPDIRSFGVDYKNVKYTLFQFLETRRRCDLAVAKYETIKAECELESACLAQMVKLESTLHDSKPLVHEATVKLGIFATVWAGITADIRKLKTSLQYADDPASLLFIMRVDRLERMYEYLSRALRHYQVTVQLPQEEDTCEEKTD